MSSLTQSQATPPPPPKVGPLQLYPSPTRLPPTGPLQLYPSPTRLPPAGPLQPYPSPTTAPPTGQHQYQSNPDSRSPPARRINPVTKKAKKTNLPAPSPQCTGVHNPDHPIPGCCKKKRRTRPPCRTSDEEPPERIGKTNTSEAKTESDSQPPGPLTATHPHPCRRGLTYPWHPSQNCSVPWNRQHQFSPSQKPPPHTPYLPH